MFTLPAQVAPSKGQRWSLQGAVLYWWTLFGGPQWAEPRGAVVRAPASDVDIGCGINEPSTSPFDDLRGILPHLEPTSLPLSAILWAILDSLRA